VCLIGFEIGLTTPKLEHLATLTSSRAFKNHGSLFVKQFLWPPSSYLQSHTLSTLENTRHPTTFLTYCNIGSLLLRGKQSRAFLSGPVKRCQDILEYTTLTWVGRFTLNWYPDLNKKNRVPSMGTPQSPNHTLATVPCVERRAVPSFLHTETKETNQTTVWNHAFCMICM